jgi:1-acyl-sn-glycerol-3-phosphate acyltransferase
VKNFFQLLLTILLPWRWWAAYKRYIAKITTSGYIGEPSPTLEAIANVVFRFWIWAQIGKVTIVNREYLDTPGRVIVCGNHSCMADALLAFSLMHRECWSIGAYDPMLVFWGLPAVVLTKLRVIPVDRSKGKTVLEPAINCVVSGKALGIFPEGKISNTGELLPFKPGLALIANAADKRLGGKESIAIIPVHFCYGKRHAPSAGDYGKMGLKWRGGVRLTVCKPIFLHELEDRSVDAIMCNVRKAIEAVSCPTTSSTHPCGDPNA